MRTIRTLTIAAMAAVTLSGCLKGGGEVVQPQADGQEKAVRITIKRSSQSSGDSGKTRSQGEALGATKPLTFHDGLLLFCRANGYIEKVVTVSTGSGGYASGTVGILALDAGVWITDIPSLATKVCLAGNLAAAGITLNVGNYLTNAEPTVVQQYDATDGGVGKVMLYGEGNLIPATSGPGGIPATSQQFQAIFDVKPVTSRFEIAAITPMPTGGNTLSANVEGIFIDNYYAKTYINVKASQQATYNGGTVPSYTSAYYSTPGVVHDWDSGSSGLTPGSAASPVWSYNVLAPEDGDNPFTIGTIEPLEMPAIIIKVKDVVVNGTPAPGPHFLTITKFFRNVTTPITELVRGEVYNIANIEFEYNHLTPAPYMSSKSAYVEVTMIDWTTVPTNWDF